MGEGRGGWRRIARRRRRDAGRYGLSLPLPPPPPARPVNPAREGAAPPSAQLPLQGPAGAAGAAQDGGGGGKKRREGGGEGGDAEG